MADSLCLSCSSLWNLISIIKIIERGISCLYLSDLFPSLLSLSLFLPPPSPSLLLLWDCSNVPDIREDDMMLPLVQYSPTLGQVRIHSCIFHEVLNKDIETPQVGSFWCQHLIHCLRGREGGREGGREKGEGERGRKFEWWNVNLRFCLPLGAFYLDQISLLKHHFW